MILLHYVVLIAFILLFATEVYARDTGQYANVPPSIKQWYSTQHNKHGAWCCDNSDGEQFLGDYQLDADGSVEFTTDDGVHHKLPEWMALDDSNPTGHAVWWHLGATDYCFAIGAGG